MVVLVHFTEKLFDQINLTERHLTEKSVGSFDRKIIFPKGHLTEVKKDVI
jgi:hypothetical protein